MSPTATQPNSTQPTATQQNSTQHKKPTEARTNKPTNQKEKKTTNETRNDRSEKTNTINEKIINFNTRKNTQTKLRQKTIKNMDTLIGGLEDVKHIATSVKDTLNESDVNDRDTLVSTLKSIIPELAKFWIMVNSYKAK